MANVKSKNERIPKKSTDFQKTKFLKLLLNEKILVLILGLGFLNSIGATEKERLILTSKDVAEWTGMIKINPKIKRSGIGSFELYGKYPTELISKKMIPIDLNKTYKLSAWMRTLDRQFPASAYMGLRMYDKNKHAIYINNVGVCEGTESTLLKSKAGTTELLVALNPNWEKQKYAAIAFNIEDNYQDLPNFNISPEIKKIIKEENNYKVILKTPLKKSYPAGTKIRLHLPWGVPLYSVTYGWAPTEWKQFSATLTGEALSGAPNDKFWRGTKYVRVFVWFGNYDRIPTKSARLLVDDINFVCGEKNLMMLRALRTTFSKPKILQEFNKQWKFQTDAKDAGLGAGWMNADWNDNNWALLDANCCWQEQGYPNYHGVAWYRKTIACPQSAKEHKRFLYFGAVDGNAAVFLNGQKLGEHNLGDNGSGWNQPFWFDITDYLKPGKSATLAVRVKKNAYKSGIFKGVSIVSADALIGSE
jgi:hypothetical protein